MLYWNQHNMSKQKKKTERLKKIYRKICPPWPCEVLWMLELYGLCCLGGIGKFVWPHRSRRWWGRRISQCTGRSVTTNRAAWTAPLITRPASTGISSSTQNHCPFKVCPNLFVICGAYEFHILSVVDIVILFSVCPVSAPSVCLSVCPRLVIYQKGRA